LLEEGVGAVAVPKVVVLPWLTGRCGAGGDGVPVDEDLDRAEVAFEVAGVVVCLGQSVRSDLGVVLGGAEFAVCPSQACNSNSVIGSLAL
jgi:hypothetical protein